MENRAEGCGLLTEQQLVDCALGLSGQQAALQHAEHCRQCQAAIEEWRELTSGQPGSGAGNREFLPSEYVRSSLHAEVSKLRQAARLRKQVGWIAVAAMAVILVFSGALRTMNAPSALLEQRPFEQLAAQYEPEAHRVLEDPSTLAYPINDRHPGALGNGFIWLNGISEEILVLLDGVDQQAELDYQFWAISRGNYQSIGILKHSDGKAHLYVKANYLRQPDDIILTREPKGGSEAPTSPETVLVRFSR